MTLVTFISSECTGPNSWVILFSVVVTWLYVAVLHVLVQWAFGTFGLVLFFIQLSSFILYPETEKIEQVCTSICFQSN